jgi:FG-GAP-like repeat/IPT/TIG domain/FG-GAP repeat
MPKLYPGNRLLLCIALGAPSLVFAQPVITAVSPLAGPLNSTVTITGSNFSSTPSANVVWFGSVAAPVTSASSGSLTVTVPPGGSDQPITVTAGNLSSFPFKPFITTFSDTGQFKPTAFSSVTTIPTSSAPQSIFSMDLDGDGKPDLVIADADSNLVMVYHNNSTSGNISFALQGSYYMGSGTYPVGVIAGDLDGDGKPEIVAYNLYTETISILLNTSTPGHISFAAPVSYPAGDYGSAPAIADLNGDGKPEIAVACTGTHVISTYTNKSTVGHLSFSPMVNWALAAYAGPYKVEVADIDGDGLPDMAAADGNNNIVSVLRNTSGIGDTVSFAAHVDFATGNGAQGLAIGDLDGDGKPDMAVANNNDNTLSLLQNTSSPGTISFAPQIVVNSGNGALDLVISDLDGDGKPDRAVVDDGVNAVSVHKNISTVGTIAVNPNVDYAAGEIPFSITTADFDGDGKPDLATANNVGNTISVLLNKGPNAPAIVSFSPAAGLAGTVVTITGVNLSSITGVSFGDTAATSFTLVSPTTITATVGGGATGNVTVTSTTGGTMSLPGFIYGSLPSISGISPDSGATGATILLSGSGFTGATSVTFGGTPAGSFHVISDSLISAVVGVGATGSVSVSTSTGEVSGGNFKYIYTPLPPVQLTAFSPDSAGPGATITITGQNLSGITTISFGGTPAYVFNVMSDSVIHAVVGQGSTGSLVVNGNNGEDSLTGFIYITPPPPPPGIALTGFLPGSGSTGTTITITGHYLTGATAVSFGGTEATSFNVVSDSVIQAIVGAGATGNVYVANLSSSGSLSGFTYVVDTTKQQDTPPAAFDLLSFSGTYSDNVPLLQWQATNDDILAYYALERAIDGDTTQFAVIAAISPNGIDTGMQTYSFTDSGANPGVNYYRLKMQDTTAIYSYSNTLAVRPPGKASLLNLYPNPVKYGFTDAVIPDATNASWFQLIDMGGRPMETIYVGAGITLARIDMSRMIPGVYKLTWSDGKHSAYNLILVLPLN